MPGGVQQAGSQGQATGPGLERAVQDPTVHAQARGIARARQRADHVVRVAEHRVAGPTQFVARRFRHRGAGHLLAEPSGKPVDDRRSRGALGGKAQGHDRRALEVGQRNVQEVLGSQTKSRNRVDPGVVMPALSVGHGPGQTWRRAGTLPDPDRGAAFPAPKLEHRFRRAARGPPQTQRDDGAGTAPAEAEIVARDIPDPQVAMDGGLQLTRVQGKIREIRTRGRVVVPVLVLHLHASPDQGHAKPIFRAEGGLRVHAQGVGPVHRQHHVLGLSPTRGAGRHELGEQPTIGTFHPEPELAVRRVPGDLHRHAQPIPRLPAHAPIIHILRVRESSPAQSGQNARRLLDETGGGISDPDRTPEQRGVGGGEIHQSIPVPVARGHPLDLASLVVALFRTEGSVAPVQSHLQGSRSAGRHGQIQPAIRIEIGQPHGGGLVAQTPIDLCRPERAISAPAQDTEALGGGAEHHQVHPAVSIHVPRIEIHRPGLHGKSRPAPRQGTGPIAPVEEQDEGVAGRVRRCDIGSAIPVEVPGDQSRGMRARRVIHPRIGPARGPLQYGQNAGRLAGHQDLRTTVAVQVRQPQTAGQQSHLGVDGRFEGSVTPPGEHADALRVMVRHGDVPRPVAVQIAHLHRNGPGLRLVARRQPERAVALPEQHAHAVVGRIRHRQIEPSVPVEIAPGEMLGDSPGGLLADAERGVEPEGTILSRPSAQGCRICRVVVLPGLQGVSRHPRQRELPDIRCREAVPMDVRQPRPDDEPIMPRLERALAHEESHLQPVRVPGARQGVNHVVRIPETGVVRRPEFEQGGIGGRGRQEFLVERDSHPVDDLLRDGPFRRQTDPGHRGWPRIPRLEVQDVLRQQPGLRRRAHAGEVDRRLACRDDVSERCHARRAFEDFRIDAVLPPMQFQNDLRPARGWELQRQTHRRPRNELAQSEVIPLRIPGSQIPVHGGDPHSPGPGQRGNVGLVRRAIARRFLLHVDPVPNQAHPQPVFPVVFRVPRDPDGVLSCLREGQGSELAPTIAAIGRKLRQQMAVGRIHTEPQARAVEIALRFERHARAISGATREGPIVLVPVVRQESATGAADDPGKNLRQRFVAIRHPDRHVAAIEARRGQVVPSVPVPIPRRKGDRARVEVGTHQLPEGFEGPVASIDQGLDGIPARNREGQIGPAIPRQVVNQDLRGRGRQPRVRHAGIERSIPPPPEDPDGRLPAFRHHQVHQAVPIQVTHRQIHRRSTRGGTHFKGGTSDQPPAPVV